LVFPYLKRNGLKIYDYNFFYAAPQTIKGPSPHYLLLQFCIADLRENADNR